MSLKNYLTRQGYEKLEKEYNDLLEKERPAVVEIVSWAAGNGDRSENGDYIYGKKKLREIDARIFFIKKLLNNAIIVDALEQDHSRIFFGAHVTLSIKNDSAPKSIKVTLVGTEEAEPEIGKINYLSPLGQAILGKTCGDCLSVNLNGQHQEITIIDFHYT